MMNTRRSILHSVTNIFENVADSKHTFCSMSVVEHPDVVEVVVVRV